MDIHTAYRIAYEASLNAQLVSLNARLLEASRFTMNNDMHIEQMLLTAQINAITLEVRKLNQ